MAESAQNPKLIPSKTAFLGRYSLIKTIGCDEKAKVFLGFDSKTNEYHAIKIIKHTQPNLNLEALKKEVGFLLSLKHPNIVEVIDFHESVDFITKSSQTYKVAVIVMEFIPGASLFEYIEYSGGLSEEIVRKGFQTIVETLDYCHNKGISHRDIKIESLMLDKDLNIKIIGFTTTAFMNDNNTDSVNGVILDLFSACIILFYMLEGILPFAVADPRDPIYKFICHCKHDMFWKAHERRSARYGRKITYSAEFKNLINTMFDFEPDMRLSIAELRFHSWYQGETGDLNAALKEIQVHKKEQSDTGLIYQEDVQFMIKINPFRLIEGWNFASCPHEGELLSLKELTILNNKRTVEVYQSVLGVRLVTELWSTFDIQELFGDLYKICKRHFNEVTLSRERYKIKVKAITDSGSAKFNILLRKSNENTTCIELYRTSVRSQS